MPLGQVLLCRRVRSLGGSSIDGVLQAVGLLSGAASGVGLHVLAQHCGDGAAGWWRRSLCFNWRLCRMWDQDYLFTSLVSAFQIQIMFCPIHFYFVLLLHKLPATCHSQWKNEDSLEPMTGMDMPWSVEAGAALGAGEPSTKSCLGGLTLQNTVRKEYALSIVLGIWA